MPAGEALVFEVLWDDEAKVWYTSETPIQGVLAEAPTLDELSEKLSVIIPEVLEIRNENYGKSKLPIMVKAFREYENADREQSLQSINTSKLKKIPHQNEFCSGS